MKNQVPVSIVVPLLNEESSIERLLASLVKQTLHPTEVVLVDGGSKDQTISIIQAFKKKSLPFNLRVIQEPGANRSLSRNLGIKEAKSEIIALTDAGCAAKPDWLEKLTVPFSSDENVQVVAGFYDPQPKNWWEDVMAEMTCVRPWNFNPKTFLPSSRSLAVTKKAWKAVRGYPENLAKNEDIIFAQKLKDNFGKQWAVVKDAQVIWQQPKTLSELTDKVYAYAVGDLEAKYERHTAKISAATWRVMILLCLAFPLLYFPYWYIRGVGIGLFALYIVATWMKHPRMLKYPLAWVSLPLIQLAVDIALLQSKLSFFMTRR